MVELTRHLGPMEDVILLRRTELMSKRVDLSPLVGDGLIAFVLCWHLGHLPLSRSQRESSPGEGLSGKGCLRTMALQLLATAQLARGSPRAGMKQAPERSPTACVDGRRSRLMPNWPVKWAESGDGRENEPLTG